ncbi:MAG: efflux RND transporter periplasmic adaptor subunit [Acidobacteria bacterium]|nr:efflux RND transporter periplasmic adaptor subunit [Acidobacteriota bacterium]
MRAAVFIPLIACTVALGACGTRPSAQARTDADDKPDVTLTTVARKPIVHAITVAGTLAAEEQVMLSLRVTGRLDELLVDLGSPVRKGQVIARLMPTDFELRLQQAEAALQSARARLGLPVDGEDDHVDIGQAGLVRQAEASRVEARSQRDRIATFVTRGISARAELDTANATLEIMEGRYQDALEELRNRQAILAQRRSEVALARQALDDTVLRSPLDGVVRERQAMAGEFRAAGSPVVTVVRQDPLRLQLAVPERRAGDVRIGQVVKVSVEGNTEVHDGRIVRVSPSITEGTRTLAIEASVPNAEGRLRPGSFARADIVVSEAPALVVPQSAVVVFAGVEKVMTIDGGVARERRVRTGRRAGTDVEILEGVDANTEVILNAGSVTDGLAVTVTR